MNKHRIGETFKFRTAAFWGIGVLLAIVLWSAGCGRTSSEHGQLPPDAEGFSLGMRPPAGDSTRLLRNAHYLKMMGRPELALRELEAAYQQDPGNIRVMNGLALAYDELGEFKRAQKLYQKALTLDVSNQALNNNLCFSYYLAGQWDQAEACFRQALSRNPQNIMARNNLGLLLCRRGRTEEARRLWQETEGEVVAQKKLQQVMVALGGGETPHYAQLPPSAPVASAPPQEKVTPPAPVAQDADTAKPWLSVPEPKPQVPAAPPAKAREPVKVAANPAPAVPPAKETPAPITASKPAPPQEPAPAVKTKVEPAAATPVAKPAPAVVKTKPAPQVATATPAKTQSPPAPPQQVAKTDKKLAPAAAPTLASKPGEIKAAAAPAPVKLTKDKLAQSGIEVLNGSSAFNLAREARSQLKEAGFKVVGIGNYRNFADKNTLIYYRPGAEEVARALSAKYPKSRLEIGEKMYHAADIRIILGKDAVTRSAVASEPASAAEKIAAGIGPSHPEAKSATPAPALTVAQAKTTAQAPLSVPSVVAKVKAMLQPTASHTYLTADELVEAGIDIRNGTPAPDLARKTRSMLTQEGYNVVNIGNHIDFGAEKTIIFYRPGAEKVAKNLNAKFFSNSSLEQTAKLPEDVAVKVLLGKDLLQRTDVMAKLDE